MSDQIDNRHEHLAHALMVWRPGFWTETVRALDKQVLVYICRHTSYTPDYLDRCTLARVRDIADGLSDIIEAENGTG